MNKTFFRISIFLVSVVIVFGVLAVLTTKPRSRPISKLHSVLFVITCRAKDVYSYHNGEVGLLLSDGTTQPVAVNHREDLDRIQNPLCPYRTAAME